MKNIIDFIIYLSGKHFITIATMFIAIFLVLLFLFSNVQASSLALLEVISEKKRFFLYLSVFATILGIFLLR
ncbi:hypothetical protein [Escherichia coli]|uniref:hypothetical protein n=1 Tax=Escherichia coli TaxID=562 RepID=UPI00207B1FD7|nr:hypothetical protein [Escherichia coli]